MNKFKRFIVNTFFKELLPSAPSSRDAAKGGQRELASNIVKRLVYKTTDDDDFEEPSFSMEDIENAYDTDSYVRQGVDKYVDQIFKEGYMFYGKDTNVVDYLKLRLDFAGEATSTPISQFLIDIAEDIVKYGNCIIIKARSNDQNAFPQGLNIQGLDGKDPVAGYFCANPSSMTVLRDDKGVIKKWKQETDVGEQEFKPEDVLHFYYKRPKGNAYGTSFLVPVLDDVRALRQAEENVLKMMYRNIYPFHHISVGSEDAPGTEAEVEKIIEAIDNMDVEGGIATTERVKITPIASDKVINAEPYLKYMEERVFSGMGIPAIMFGRGNTSNRSTGDNMTSEMADRIRAMCKIIEMFFNAFIIKELLMEGGYDPILNPEHVAELTFNDNDVDIKIKKEVHAIYKYEHNSITEDEMRNEIGLDPINDEDREKMHVELITRMTAKILKSKSPDDSKGTKETDNKSKNGGGKKSKDSEISFTTGLIKDSIDEMINKIDKYVLDCYNRTEQILQITMEDIISNQARDITYIIKASIDDSEVSDYLSNMVISNAITLCNNIHKDLIGVNTHATEQNYVIDILNSRINVFEDSVINFLVNKTISTQVKNINKEEVI